MDANILVPLSIGKSDYDYGKVELVITNVKNGTYKLFISNFVLAEVLHALRGVILDDMIKDSKSSGHNQLHELTKSQSFKDLHTKKCHDAYQTIVNFATSNTRQVEMEPRFSNYPLDIFAQDRELLHKIKGDIRVYEIECGKCEERGVRCNRCGFRSKVKYKGVDSRDVLHMLMAKSFKCDLLITADKGFNELIPEAHPVQIVIL